MPRFGLLSLTLAALTTTAVAEDRVPAFVDMRLNLEGTSLRYDIDDGEYVNDFGTRVGVSWTGSLGLDAWGGVVWGLGGSWGYGSDDDSVGGLDLTVQTGTLDLFIGYGFAFTEFLQIEAMPVISVGRAWFRSEDDSAAASYWEYGLRGNLAWTLSNGFQFGLTGSLIIANENDVDVSLGAQEVGDFDNTRLTAGAFIGVRL